MSTDRSPERLSTTGPVVTVRVPAVERPLTGSPNGPAWRPRSATAPDRLVRPLHTTCATAPHRPGGARFASRRPSHAPCPTLCPSPHEEQTFRRSAAPSFLSPMIERWTTLCGPLPTASRKGLSCSSGSIHCRRYDSSRPLDGVGKVGSRADTAVPGASAPLREAPLRRDSIVVLINFERDRLRRLDRSEGPRAGPAT